MSASANLLPSARAITRLTAASDSACPNLPASHVPPSTMSHSSARSSGPRSSSAAAIAMTYSRRSASTRDEVMGPLPMPGLSPLGLELNARAGATARDRPRDPPRVDRDLPQHAADRVRVPDEVESRGVRVGLCAVDDGASLHRLEDPELADQGLQAAAEAGARDDRVGLNADAVRQQHVG